MVMMIDIPKYGNSWRICKNKIAFFPYKNTSKCLNLMFGNSTHLVVSEIDNI